MLRAEHRVVLGLGALVLGAALFASGGAQAAKSVDGEARRALGGVEGELARHRANVREIDAHTRRVSAELEAIQTRLLGLMPRIDAAQGEIEKSEERLGKLSGAMTIKEQALTGRREEFRSHWRASPASRGAAPSPSWRAPACPSTPIAAPV